jgi:hypothetical protein
MCNIYILEKLKLIIFKIYQYLIEWFCLEISLKTELLKNLIFVTILIKILKIIYFYFLKKFLIVNVLY